MKAAAAALLLVLMLAYPIPHGFSQEDYRVLPIRADLQVNLVFVDVDIDLFGVRSFEELLSRLGVNVRKEAMSQLYSLGSELVYAPYVFDVKLKGIQIRGPALTEFRNLWRGLVQYIPRDLLNLYGIRDQLSGIHAATALKTLVDFGKKHIQQPLEGYTIFFICSETALRGVPIYYSYGIFPETGRVGGELLLNMYGGPWWGRYVFVDLCAETGYDDYPRVTEIPSPSGRIALLSKYVDELIDLQFVKSTIYYPYYNLQIFVDTVVVDATGQGINYDQLVQVFDVEITEQALKTLTPYNFYYFRMKRVDARDVPGFTQIIKLQEAVLGGERRTVAVFDPYTAYELLYRAGLIEPPQESYKYVPVIIVVTDYDTYVEEPGVAGIAIENPKDPKYALAAVAAANYRDLFRQGMSRLVAHEIGHVLGLRHPHDDFDETTKRDRSGLMIYTDSVETFMAYRTTWVETYSRRFVREGFYPVRTFWSIFDLDTIDRATTSLLLMAYEEDYASIVEKLNSVGISVDDLPQLKNALAAATELARKAVAEFKRMNYFDRLEFRGLGAQTTNAVEHAFMASSVTSLLKVYVEGLVTRREKLAPTLEKMQKEIDELVAEVRRLERERETVDADTSQVLQKIDEASRAADELRNQLKELEKEAQQLPELEKRKTELEKTVAEERAEAKQLGAEASQLRTFNMLLMVVAAVFVAVGGLSVLLRRLKVF